MNRESDLLFGLLALQMGFVSKDHLLEAAAVWLGDPDAKPLPRLLQDRGFLKEYQHAAVKMMVEAHLRDHGGDPVQSLAAATVPRALKEDLLGTVRRTAALTPERETLAQSVMQIGEGDVSRVIVVTRPAESKYDVKGEIGHGGLGTVLNAVDNDIGREVALKIMREDMSGDSVERFLLEGRVTGRLEHPHIVPVHEVGVRVDKDGARQVYFTMKKIEGSDLGRLLRDIARGGAGVLARPAGRGGETRATGISLRRLVDHFHDVCLAVAFAHSKGVLHRDLKPSNIMIGAFGETLLVDWGLAKVKGEQDFHFEGDETRLRQAGIEHPDTPALTMEGDIMGTPAYMSPEQAEGRVAEVDERSDVWALGAVLYEIMTLHPPFEGRTLEEMLSQVKAARVTPPGERICGAPSVPWSIPPELEAICLKCLMRRKEDRYPSAESLAQEIELFLEGVKERERREKEARERVEEGRKCFARYRALAGEIEAQEKRVKAISETIKPHQTVEEKRPLWDEEARLKAMEEERIIAFIDASAHFGQALTCDPESRDALDGKCELLVDRFLDAERKRDRKQMLLERRTLEQYDRDGRYAARLEAPGRLTIRTYAFDCKCLRPVRRAPARARSSGATPDGRTETTTPPDGGTANGWRVEIAEKCTIPWRDGRPRPDLPLEDKDRPVPRVSVSSSVSSSVSASFVPPPSSFAHRPSCPRREVRGVEVWIARYEERDKRLQPGPERLLGVTPLVAAEVPNGSYRCRLQDPGAGFLPVLIRRGETWEQEVNLYPAEDVPKGFCCVPGGPHLAGEEYVGGGPNETRISDDFFIAQFPVTCGEYLEFLNDLASGGESAERGTTTPPRDGSTNETHPGLAEARRHQPRVGDRKFWIEEGGRFRLPTPEEDREKEWSPGWPVIAINWFDAIAYCAWRSDRDGRVYLPPHEEEFEKAARGVDGRIYPYGDDYDGTFSQTSVSLSGTTTLRPVGSFPIDESPYGVRDLAGEAATWCCNEPQVPFRNLACLRGGAWSGTGNRARSANRRGLSPASLNDYLGVRLVWRPRTA